MGWITRILGMAVGASIVDLVATFINPILGIIVTIGSILWLFNQILDIVYKISHLG